MSDMKRCPSCNSTNLTTKVENYHFIESGLNNVYLVDAEVLECKDCGEKLVPIFRPFDLMDCLAKDIIQKDTLLKDPEIGFLRKNLGMKIADLAGLLDDLFSLENPHVLEDQSVAHQDVYESLPGPQFRMSRWTCLKTLPQSLTNA